MWKFVQRMILTSAAALTLALPGCGPPDGEQIAHDIGFYDYDNRPLQGATLTRDDPEPEGNGFSAVPFDAMNAAARANPARIGAAIASADVPWRVPAHCRAEFRLWTLNSKQTSEVMEDDIYDRFLAAHAQCEDHHSLVGVAISGGGPKSAIYATEVLFELARYGLAEEIDVISSVSGGSYAAAVYAMSCEPGAPGCGTEKNRLVWDYDAVTGLMHTNSFIRDFGVIAAVRSPLSWFRATGSNTSDTYARVLSRNYDIPLSTTFADLNPGRPNLILNATNDTRSRADFDANSHIPRGARRPLSADDALHFSFTKQYFWRLLSDLDSYPLVYGVAASGAFPAVVDRVGLRHYRVPELLRLPDEKAVPARDLLPCGYPDREQTRDGPPTACDAPDHSTPRPQYITLLDGGTHDNFGVTELSWIIECQFGLATPNGGFLRRTDIAAAPPGPLSVATIYRRHCGRTLPPRAAPKSILIIGINSSLIRSEGEDDETPKPVDRIDRLLPYVKPIGALEAVDQVMGASGEKRREALASLIDTMSRAMHKQDSRTYMAHAAGPFRYLDIDMEAVQILYCEQKLLHDKALLNSTTGGSHAERCRSLRGVLDWQLRRNLSLPELTSDFCPNPMECSGLERFVGSDIAAQTIGNNDIVLTPNLTDGMILPTRVFNNRHLFEAIRGVGTLVSDPGQVYAIRYVARWAVAHRLWELCTGPNALVLHNMGEAKYRRVCVDRLPPRPVDDTIGGARFRRDVL